MEIQIWVLSGITTLLLGVISYFLRDLHLSFKSMKRGIEELTFGTNNIQNELNNNTKEVAELKADLTNFKDAIDKRLDRQENLGIENRERIAVVETKIEKNA